MEVPQNGGFMLENPMKKDDLGVGNLHFRSCHSNSTFDPHVCSSAPISIIVTACCGHAIFGPGKFIAQPAAKWIKYCFFVNPVNG